MKLVFCGHPSAEGSRAIDWRWVRWVVAAGFLSGLLYIFSPQFSDVQQFCEEERIAIHLARGDGFLSPFDLSADAPVTSWSPPVYPGIVAGVYRVFGIRSDASVMALLVLQVCFRTAAATAILLIGWACFDRFTGLIAAGCLLLHPLFLRAMGFYWDNFLALALFLWLLYWAIDMRGRRSALSEAALMGLAMGLLMLTNTAYALALVPLACMAAGAVANPSPAGPPPRARWAAFRQLARLAVLGLAGAAVLAPWTTRNYLRFNRLFFVRANLNTELWIGNVPESAGWMTLETLDHHPSRNDPERRRLLREGELQYFQTCGERFRCDYQAAPLAFWGRCFNRSVFAFLGYPFSGVHYPLLPNIRRRSVMVDRLLLNTLLALLGIVGAWKAWRAGAKWGMSVLFIGCLAVAPYCLTQMYDRYTLPLNALLLLPAAWLVARLARRLAQTRETRPSLAA